MEATTENAPVSAEQRKESLARAVADQVRRGWHVESQSDYQAILIRGRHVRHILHAVLTLLTVGAWAVVWLVLWLVYRERRQVVSVDAFGHTSIR